MTFATPYEISHTGIIRHSVDDFIVNEVPAFTPTGEGEHLWLKVKKTGANTDWVAGQLARIFDVKKMDVGYAGLKDRHAVATQWFSIYLPGKSNPDVAAIMPDLLASEVQILEQTRHNKKLRRGTLKGNHFTITIRDCVGNNAALENTFKDIAKQGIPNYFGSQRFGNRHSNIESATAWFRGEFKPGNRNHRSIYLSAARSWVFNHILSERVNNGTWNKALAGDVFMLGDSGSWFVDDGDEQLNERIKQLDIHPTGALWGKGNLDSRHEVADMERKIAQQQQILCDGLERHGLKPERRALRIKIENLQYQWLDKTSLQLSFALPAGAYATVLLEQFVKV